MRSLHNSFAVSPSYARSLKEGKKRGHEKSIFSLCPLFLMFFGLGGWGVLDHMGLTMDAIAGGLLLALMGAEIHCIQVGSCVDRIRGVDGIAIVPLAIFTTLML